ncbi:DUF1292 domain-containing protein [Clostridium sp. 'deep sea']|uniref:DUF1292 domain-containing protein n=1 Tax=Clostridium sp. 'deep sea' TaxID=2779445 RepID=UPI001896A044|nr:DUF1292 domain-containing protein [Clostridium sp. 'deep sea']QOR36638.1 DUF1292 domain-containing protein [Clostridium sp. 'deep sea']
MTEDKNTCHDECCEEEMDVITITLEDDSEVDCYVIMTFELDGKDYIALLPEDADEILLYNFKELEDGDLELDNIDDDAEFEKAAEAFHALYEEEEGCDCDDENCESDNCECGNHK